MSTSGRTPMDHVRRIAIGAAISLVTFIVVYAALTLVGGRVDISDPGLESAIRSALEQESGPLRRNSLERITHLDAARYGIRDLADIELLPHLRTLDLSGNTPRSLAPLAGQTRLEELRLRDTGITSAAEMDLPALAQQGILRRLDLSDNRDLSDISEIARFTGLQELHLRNTAVDDIEPLRDLAVLRILDLRETNLAGESLEPLTGLAALEELNLRESGVTDISALRDLTGLRYLNLHSNTGIGSLDPLRGLTRLRTLIMRHVPVTDQLDVLAGMRELNRLNIRNTGVTNLEVLAELMRRGALQDDPNGGISAEVDIRDNPIEGSPEAGPYGYDLLLPYWNKISRRHPERLPRAPSGEIHINEVMTSNGTIHADAAGNYPDWIELHNPGTNPVDLSGMILSPGREARERLRLPDGAELSPGEHVLVFASGTDSPTNTLNTRGPSQELHAPFTLSSGGTEVVLQTADRRTVIDRVTVPAIPRDTSWARVATDGNDESHGGDRWTVFMEPTPGEPNSRGRTYRPIVFSHESGFHDTPFELALSLPDGTGSRGNGDTPETVDIYYTLDGSEPDPSTPDGTRTYRYRDHETGSFIERTSRTHRYSGPIPVTASAPSTGEPPLSTLSTTVPEAEFWEWRPPEDPGFHATVVRAVAHDRETARSSVYTATFFVTPEGADEFPLGVVAITADPERLYGYEEGIYVPGRIYEEHRDEEELWMRRPANYQEAWEVPAHIAFYEPDGYRGFGIDGGMRIHGGWSRSHPLKSLRLYARKDHDRINYFEYPLFPGAQKAVSHEAVTRYKRVMLRSGQSLFRSHLQDAVAQSHVKPHLEVDLLAHRPVVHFINGEYWGIKNLRERFDRFYLEGVYDVDPEEVVVLDGPLAFDHQIDEGRPGDNRPFRDLLRFVRDRDMSRRENYRRVQDRMDVESFIDYNIIRIFSGDSDGVTKHVAVWRVRREYDPDLDVPSGADGRWRWHTWDLDNAFMFLENDTMTFYGNDRTDEEHVEAYLEDYRAEEIDPELLGDSAALRSAAGVTTRDPVYTELFTELLQSDFFRELFINRFMDLLNTVYRPATHVAAIREAAALIEPEIDRHIRRWGYPVTSAYWRLQVERHVTFARERPAIQREQIRDYFYNRGIGIGEEASIHLELPREGGTVQVNTISLEEHEPESWEGIYFTGVPVELEALPAGGYVFSRWDGDVPEDLRTTERITITLDRAREISPRFVSAGSGP